MEYLHKFHPEVFCISPRPGGLAKIKQDENTTKSKKLSSVRSVASRSEAFNTDFDISRYVSREHRIRTVMNTSPWVFFDESFDLNDVPSPMQDAIKLLTITVTTILLLASEHKDISRNHLEWTYSYLSCIKDGSGNIPVNVKGIMNHIKMTDNSIESIVKEEVAESDDKKAEKKQSDEAPDEKEISPPPEAVAPAEAAPTAEEAPPVEQAPPVEEAPPTEEAPLVES